ncbi:MAG: carbon monoxide dehydrogenase [Gemmatimonadetes bacterium]|nr:carbon monoxide dehydrogenase [Gemmatimonadota bacterium]
MSSYHRPPSVAEALRLKRELPGSSFIAGGTDLLVQMKDRVRQPTALISIRHLSELTRIETDGGARLGAATPLSDLADDSALMTGWPILGEALRDFASVQIRGSATIGGNLCNGSPAADAAPALIVLGARVRIAGLDGERLLPVEQLFEAPGRTRVREEELLVSIELDPPLPSGHGVFLKKMRTAMDVSLASIASLALLRDGRLEEIRLAAGSVAPVPMRLHETEKVLRDRPLTPERIAEARRVARDEVRPITDIRAGADYRRHIVGVFVQRALEATLEKGDR